ncbi:hypothetical protein D9M71_429850 [compost metagenome]
MRQPFFVAILRNHDKRIDGVAGQLRIRREQGVGGFDAQVGGFLLIGFARQECRTDLAQDERLVFAETRTLLVIIRALCRHVARNALDANHHGFPIILAALYHRLNQANQSPGQQTSADQRAAASTGRRPP